MIRCDRCRRRPRGDTELAWIALFKAWIAVGLFCPGCQTPDETAEAVINEATTDYVRDGFGPIVITKENA